MKRKVKTKDELMAELKGLKKRVKELEKVEARLKKKEQQLSESEEKYRKLFEYSIEGIGISKGNRVVDANRALIEMEGYRSLDEYKKALLTARLTPASKKFVLERRRSSKRGEPVKPVFELRIVRKDGEIRDVVVSTVDVVIKGKNYTMSSFRDITENMRSQRRLQMSEERYRSLVESTDDSIYLVDKDYKYVFMNRKHRERMRFKGDEYMGQPYGMCHSQDETRLFVRDVKKVFQSGKSVQHEHPSGRDGKFFLRTLSPIKEKDGSVIAVSVVSKNISQMKRMQEELRSLTLTDDLTGLFNRRGFYMLAEQQLRMAGRLGKRACLLYADVDDLKEVNDRFGHKEGDRLLRDLASLLKENFRDSDVISRVGGDEFAMVTMDRAKKDIDVVIKRLEKLMDEYCRRRRSGYKTSLSFGVSFYDPDSPCSLDELVHDADHCMYEEKRNRKHNGRSHLDH